MVELKDSCLIWPRSDTRQISVITHDKVKNALSDRANSYPFLGSGSFVISFSRYQEFFVLKKLEGFMLFDL